MENGNEDVTYHWLLAFSLAAAVITFNASLLQTLQNISSKVSESHESLEVTTMNCNIIQYPDKFMYGIVLHSIVLLCSLLYCIVN